MKKNYTLVFAMLLLFMQQNVSAQQPQLIGATEFGGANNTGIIYKINFDGSGFAPIYSFTGPTGYNPTPAKMILAGKNLLYGLCQSSGANGHGCLFSFDFVNNIYKDIVDFEPSNGSSPKGGLVLENNGLLYGTTFEIPGSIFSFDPVLNRFSILSTFQNCSVGCTPVCTMIQANDGKLYGTMAVGGAYGDGVIFSFNIDNNTYTKEYDFNHTVNPLFTYPKGGLVQAAGLIYGFSGLTDPNGKALIYSFNPATKALSVVHEFPANYFPNYDDFPMLTLDFFGTKLYGATSGCCAPQQHQKIFYINTLDKSYHESFTFTGSDGDGPRGGLLNYNANHFYGITKKGGSNNNGVLYQYYASALGGFIKEHDFTGGTGGAEPISNLTYVSCTIKPAKPQSITGSKTATCNKTKKYSIKPVPGATSYTWTVPAGATIKGVTNDTAITVLWGTQGGSVFVQASNDCGKSAKRTITVTVICSSKESATINKEIVSAARIFPNPTTGNVTVKFYSENASKYLIRVTDITGRILLTHEINATPGENNAAVGLHKFAKGIYRLELTGNADKKFLKIEVQ